MEVWGKRGPQDAGDLQDVLKSKAHATIHTRARVDAPRDLVAVAVPRALLGVFPSSIGVRGAT